MEQKYSAALDWKNASTCIKNVLKCSKCTQSSCAILTVLCGGKGWPGTGCVISSNLPEHPISSRDSGRSMGPAGGTSAERRGENIKSMSGLNKHNMPVSPSSCRMKPGRYAL